MLIKKNFASINFYHKIFSMKKALLILLLMLVLIPPALAVDSSSLAHSDTDRFKISLEQAMNLALEGNIELQEQRKNLGISKNDIKIANALKNPQIQSNFLVGQIARGNSSNVGVMLPIEITKRGTRKKAAEAGLSYTENKIKDYEFKLKLRVRTSYFNLLLAKSDLKIMEDRRDLLEDLLKIAQNRPKNNPNYEIDVLQADMRLKKQLVQINRAKASVRTAQYNFNKVLNLENNLTLYDAQEDSVFGQAFFTQLELPDYTELESIAFKNRYDIKMAAAKVVKARKDITVVAKQRIPDLYLSGGYAFAHDGTPGAYVGAGLDIPALYNYSPEIKNAKLQYEKAQLEYNSIINITKNVIHTNYDKFIIAQENVEHYKSILEESNRILALSKQRYQKGKTALTNLIVVEHSHQELLNEFLAAMGVYYNAYIALLQEVGLDNFTIDIDL